MKKLILYGIASIGLAISNYACKNQCYNASEIKALADSRDLIDGDYVCLEGRTVGNGTKDLYSTIMVNSGDMTARVKIDSDALITNRSEVRIEGRLNEDKRFDVPTIDATRESGGSVSIKHRITQ